MSLTNFRGGKELQDLLNTLPEKIERNIMRGALRQGANVIKKEAQALVAVDTGTLKAGLKVSTNARNGRVSAKIKATGKHAYLANWIEFGVKPHGVKKGAKRASGKYQDGKLNPGFAAHPFMRPAIDSKSSEAITAVGAAIKKKLTKQGIDAPDIEIEEP